MDSKLLRTVLETEDDGAVCQQAPPVARRQSSSQESEDSQTAADFIRSQLQLEADAREALPYSIEHCTKPLGRLRQSVFACLTCNPPPADPAQPYDHPAGVCYACSVQCHGEHTLVEIFNKRNFTCDCGTSRFSTSSSPCALRINAATKSKGGVRSETPDAGNKYNHNFRNRFCGCDCDYDPFQQKGTMFQCLGLGTHDTGGCGEDWWHPGCLVGLGPDWFDKADKKKGEGEAEPEPKTTDGSGLPTIAEDDGAAVADVAANGEEDEDEEEEVPLPPGFPHEEDFEGFICYKCVDANPWIKRYAGTPGFLGPVFFKREEEGKPVVKNEAKAGEREGDSSTLRKRKAVEEATEADAGAGTGEAANAKIRDFKKVRLDDGVAAATSAAASADAKPVCKLASLPLPPPSGSFSLFFTEGFRDHLCRCDDCFPQLRPHPQLLEEEETYEPPVSEDGDMDGAEGSAGAGGGANGGGSHGSGSLYDRGESALRNVDRVRAIEGVMAYNHLKDKLKPFFQQFAENGQAISAEDIKAYFAKLRGDEQAIRDAGEAARSADLRREQDGY